MTATPPPAVDDPVLQQRLERHRRIARVMDEAVPIPGTRRTIGLDPVIGLVPGFGDLAGSAISSIVIVDAIRSRVPVPVLGRMGWNILVDASLGLVPFFGDIADVLHRAHRRNSLLLRESIESGSAGAVHGRSPSFGYVLAGIAVAFLPLVLALVVGIVALVALLSLIF